MDARKALERPGRWPRLGRAGLAWCGGSTGEGGEWQTQDILGTEKQSGSSCSFTSTEADLKGLG